MNRVHEIIFRLLITSVVLCSCFAVTTLAQTPRLLHRLRRRLRLPKRRKIRLLLRRRIHYQRE